MGTKRKKILLKAESRKWTEIGVNFLADAVEPTLGPYGQNFILGKGKKITSDGKNIAFEIEHENEVANEAIFHLRKASIDTEQKVKDASTTAIALGRAIFNECIKQMPSENVLVSKMSASQLLETLEKEVDYVFEELDKMATPITSEAELIEATLVSSQNKKLAKVIGSTQWAIGLNGVMIAEEILDDDIHAEIVRGVLIDNGLSATFVINNEEKQCLEVSSTPFLLTTNSVIELKELGYLFDKLARSGHKKITIMARAFTENALKACGEYAKGGFTILPVNAPYVDQRNVMLDLEAVLGGRFIDFEKGDLKGIELKDLGFAERIMVERYRAVYTGTDNKESRERISKRIQELKEKSSGSISVFEKENLEKRIAMLESGFAIISVGALTEGQRKRLKDRADDAVGTAKSALNGGVVPGGGLAYKKIAESLPDTSLLKIPLMRINEQIMFSAPEGFEIEEWVKDPVNTLKVALGYAWQVAGNLATANGASVDMRDKPRFVQEVNSSSEDDE